MKEAIGATTRRLVISIVGAILLSLGALMLITPGPGLLLLAAGLAVLAKEYSWPRRILGWFRTKFPS